MTPLGVLLGGAALLLPLIVFDVVSQGLLARGVRPSAVPTTQSAAAQAHQQAARNALGGFGPR